MTARTVTRANEEDLDIGRVYVHAKRAGKPILVLVVPESSDERATRAALFTELLARCSDEVLADLALCEVITRTLNQLDPVVTGVGGKEPLMILIETDSPFTRYTILDAPIADHAGAPLGRLIHDAVSPDVPTLRRRAEQTRARLDSASLSEIEAGIAARCFPSLDVVRKGAALVRLASETNAATRSALLAPLAAAGASALEG